MAKNSTDYQMMGETKPFFSRAPLFWAIALAILCLPEGWAMAYVFFHATFMPGIIVAHAAKLGFIAALGVVTSIGYLVWHQLSFGENDLDKIHKDRWAGRSLLILAVYMAVAVGMAATLFAFGQRGPFGAVLKGISGPELTNVDAKFWPLAFIAGAAVVFWAAKSIYVALQEYQGNSAHENSEGEE